MQTAGPALERKGDVAAFLTALEPGSVFFIDEIHRLTRAVEETLYPAMEDRRLPIVLGQGAGARTVTLDLPAFTLVGATTRTGLLTTPLRERFGVCHRLEHYPPDDLAQIVERSAGILDVGIDEAGAEAIADAGARHPRVANRLLKRVRDFAQVHGTRRRSRETVAIEALEMLEVDVGRPRAPRPRAPAHDRGEVRRRPGRAVDAGRRGRRGARHDRGRLRALSAPARADQAHPRGRVATASRLRAPRARDLPETARAGR